MTLKKAKQTMYYDRVANELEELLPGDLVRIQLQQSNLQNRKEWTLARVQGKLPKMDGYTEETDITSGTHAKQHATASLRWCCHPPVLVRVETYHMQHQCSSPLPSAQSKQKTSSQANTIQSGPVVRPPACFPIHQCMRHYRE